MPHGPLTHISFVVHDLDKSIENWTKILGVLDPGQIESKVVRYDEFDGGGDQMKWATFVSPHGAEIQLMQPDPNSHLGKRLAKKGEHVHHICFAVADVEGSLQKLSDDGIKVVGGISSDPNLAWQRWGWVSHESANGVLLEIAKPYESHNDGRWHPAEV